jgi:hypothetical protein
MQGLLLQNSGNSLKEKNDPFESFPEDLDMYLPWILDRN